MGEGSVVLSLVGGRDARNSLSLGSESAEAGGAIKQANAERALLESDINKRDLYRGMTCNLSSRDVST